MIELAHGCYHMTCLCKAEFCYLCQKMWKTCACTQWDEGRLVAAAQARVNAQLGAHRPPPPRAVPVPPPPPPQPVLRPTQARVPTVRHIFPTPLHQTPVGPTRSVREELEIYREDALERYFRSQGNPSARVVTPATQPVVKPQTRPTTLYTVPAATLSTRNAPVTVNHTIVPARPGVPTVTRSNVPTVARPSVPAVTRPSVSTVTSPSVPTVPRPSVPTVTRPSMPTRSSVPSVTGPSVPAASPTCVVKTESHYERLVREAIDELRVNHDCQHSKWIYRPGGGQCQTCYHHLPLYLFVSPSPGLRTEVPY
jgi:hypothetical protein